MTWLDWVLVLWLVASAIYGLVKGLFPLAFGLAGLVIGIVLARRLYSPVSTWFGFISNETAARVVAFVIIVAVVLVVAALLGRLAQRALASLSLGWVDRLGGAILGLAVGAVSAGALLAVLSRLTFLGLEPLIGDSPLASALLKGLPLLSALLPGEFRG